MTLTQALKKRKEYFKKLDDLKDKISRISARMENQTAEYANEPIQINEWIQARKDIIQEIEKLTYAIQVTNIITQVTIELNNKSITKSIAEWMQRRDKLAKLELESYTSLTDRNLRAQTLKQPDSNGAQVIQVVFNYNPKERDVNTELFRTEPNTIDSVLETINATTDIVEGKIFKVA